MKYLVFDCETTGLTSNCNVLTAFFIILDEKFNILDELDLKIKHDFYTIYTKALEINKINILEHDKIAISKTESINQLNTFLLNHNIQDNNFKLLGHNIKFDINMLKSNNIINQDTLDGLDIIDTYELSKKLKSNNKIPKYQSLSLTNLCYYLDINLNPDNNETNFHNAQFDCCMTIELYKKLIEL